MFDISNTVRDFTHSTQAAHACQADGGANRDGKQNLGLEAYMLRSAEGAKRHLCLGLVAFTLLQLGAQHPRLGRLIRDHVARVGEMCQRTVTETARLFRVTTPTDPSR